MASNLLEREKTRARQPGEARRRGTIDPDVYLDRTKQVRDFLAFLNECHGQGAVATMTLADLSMVDVEGYNQDIATKGYSASQVSKRMQVVRRIVNHAGRQEHGRQLLSWNWESRQVHHGREPKEKRLPTVEQLKKLLAAADARGRVMIWIGLGLGFGQSDIAALRLANIDKDSYDMRRGKTGINRWGRTPPMVWGAIREYLKGTSRPKDELLFVTRDSRPVVHAKADSVLLWWNRLRQSIGETRHTLEGFYILRHLGATVHGAREGCSLADLRSWLGHGASSAMADVYMKPLKPEYKEVVAWVGQALESGRANLRVRNTPSR
ncbi:MAG: hypothetical protein WD042_05840 [Phycisphaeraceae bacterium]